MDLHNHYIEKERNKRSKKKIFLITVGVFLGLLLIFGVFGAMYVNTLIHDPASKNSGEATFTVSKGEGTRKIAEDLEKKKFIKSSVIFLGYLKYKGKSSGIQVGDYLLKKNLNMIQIVDILTSGKVMTSKITIPEGWTNKQIENELVKKGIANEVAFQTAMKSSYNYDFLSQSPDGDLQGFLYPDTYFLSSRPTASEVIKKMLDEFGQKSDKEIKAKLSGQKLSYYQVLTLASIVEREVKNGGDRKKVAGVFLNRLDIGMKLDSDATVAYVLGSDKRILSDADIATNSPYNTYKNTGLPPGPIANPSLESIQAVLSPEKSDYIYFFSGRDGKTYFSKTGAEHEALKAKYL